MSESAAPTPAPEALPWWRALGPGFVVAATGVGAGDLIAAGVAGSRHGLAVLWAVLLGGLFKWVLNEGVSRWQFATNTTLITGMARHLPRGFTWYFLGFLLLWGFLVAAALSSACGIAAHALLPAFSVKAWGIAHAAVGFGLVLIGRYQTFERVMKLLVALMFAVVIVCALRLPLDAGAFARGLLVPSVPPGSAKFLLGVMGGVGGSVTLLCYGYWIRERGWRGRSAHRRSLLDLGSAYALTALFGVALVTIAAEAAPPTASGAGFLLRLSERLGELLGPFGHYAFLIGFWCAVFTSLLGVWQGVPYLFVDVRAALRRSDGPDEQEQTTSAPYRWFLAYLAFPPLALLWLDRPLAVVVAYAITGAFFMPFLAAVLLLLNNRARDLRELRYTWFWNGLLGVSLMLFGYLFVTELLAGGTSGGGG